MSGSSSTPILKWTRHMLPPGIKVNILENAPLAVMGGPTKGSIVSGMHPVRIGVWFGPGEDLTQWTQEIGRNKGLSFSNETEFTVCGRAARRIEATTPDRPAVHVAYVDGYGVEENPGETFVAVEFHDNGAPVVAYYIVKTTEREKYAGDEAHFFASIDCP